MRQTASSVLLMVVFLLFRSSTFSVAEHNGPTYSGKRLEAEGKLSDDAVKFLSTHFFRAESIIRKDFETILPRAIEKALQTKDETEISQILAPLVASISPTQADIAIKNSKKEIEEETKDKDPGKFDTRYVTLMERILWAALNRNGELPKSKKAETFNTAFKDPYTIARDFANEANEKSKQAAEGNKEAKKWVDENIRKETVLSIAEGLRKTGDQTDKKHSNYLIRAQAFDAEKGQSSLDMWGPNKEPQRLYLGNDEKTVNQSIDGFLEKFKSFGTNVVSRRPLDEEKELKSWFVDRFGKFTKGAPPELEVKQTEAPIAETGNSVTNSTAPITQDTSLGRLTNALNVGNCQNCHSTTVNGTSLLNASLQVEGKKVALKDFPKLFKNSKNPMFSPMKTNPTRQTFEDFAQIQSFPR